MKLFIIAGEVSGDILGASVLKSFLETNPNIEIAGIGGANILANGLDRSIFNMEDLSVMGIFEVLPKIPMLLSRINQTVQEIEKFQPDVILSVDAPDFSFRVQKKIKNRGLCNNSKLVHLVAPTVWAWRSGRAKKISKFLDLILCVLPFEPEYFIKENLNAIFVGHPMINNGVLDNVDENLKKSLGFKNDEIILGLLPGSRKSEIIRMADIYNSTLKMIFKNHKNIKIIIPTLPHLKILINDLFAGHKDKITVISKSDNKFDIFKICDFAIATSGTVGLELAACNVPHIIGYKMNNLTYKIAKKLVKVKYAHLANIILGKEVVPELIQDDCTASNLYKKISELMLDSNNDELQKNNFAKIVDQIKGGNKNIPPSKQCVNAIINII